MGRGRTSGPGPAKPGHPWPRVHRGLKSSFHAENHRLQLELYSQNQRLINDVVAGYTDEFRRYEARYRRTVRGVKRPITFDALVQKTRAAREILVGDYHTLPQAQRSFF